jgi:hypothetical protein
MVGLSHISNKNRYSFVIRFIDGYCLGLAEEELTPKEITADFSQNEMVNIAFMDGGGSAQMVYETELVKEARPELRWSEVPEDIAAYIERPRGHLSVNTFKMDVYSEPDLSSQTRGDATIDERYEVYELIPGEGGTWYRIGTKRWLFGTEENVTYKPDTWKVEFVAENKLSVYEKPSIPSKIIDVVEPGDTIVVREIYDRESFIWIMTEDHKWIPVKADDVTIKVQ